MKKYLYSLFLGIISSMICLLLIPIIWFIFVVCSFVMITVSVMILVYGITGKIETLLKDSGKSGI